MLLDFFLPSYCAGCDAPGADLCSRCAAALTFAPAIVRAARDGTPAAIALGPYEGVLRSAVLALKFRGARPVARRIGRALALKILSPFDAVVPVPLHAQRLRERGYNQAGDIARQIAAVAHAPFVEKALERSRYTAPQSALHLTDRNKNVDGAFCAGRTIQIVAGLRVLLVDDVITTGATARACARTLLAGGVRSVYLAAAAIRL